MKKALRLSYCILLPMVLSLIVFLLVLPYILKIQFLSILACLFSIIVISYIISSLLIEILVLILKIVRKKTINRCNRKIVAICMIFIVVMPLVYSIEIANRRDKFDVLLEYPNVSFMFLETEGYKLCTVCEDNVIIEYVGIWNKYKQLHKELGDFNISSINPTDIAIEIFKKGIEKGYIPEYNGYLAPGPWYFIISFWNFLGYRGPWWVYDALSSFLNFSLVRIIVNENVQPLHVAIITGFKREPFMIALDWCGVEEEWDDIAVSIGEIYEAIESVYFLIPRNSTLLSDIIEKAQKEMSQRVFKELVLDLIEIGIPLIISVDSNLVVDKLYGPIGFSGMLFSMLYTPFLPFIKTFKRSTS